jgi:ribosomal protein L11 methyltransferase
MQPFFFYIAALMQYTQVSFHTDSTDLQEILVALLGDIGYEGFVQDEGSIKAFFPAPDLDYDALNDIANTYSVSYEVTAIQQENWNKKWEENFQPVIVPDFCTVRADFHDLHPDTPYEIVINPKMSFGTGHHATTQLVMKAMQQVNFANKRVLDFGTGTGILAILASMLGASDVLAIDNDEWSYENAQENVNRNSRTNITVQLATLDTVADTFDIILANINRHILLDYMNMMKKMLNPSGTIIMSGLLEEDADIIIEAASSAGFSNPHISTHSGWIAIQML